MKGRRFLAMLCALMMFVMNFSSCVSVLAENEGVVETSAPSEDVQQDKSQAETQTAAADTAVEDAKADTDKSGDAAASGGEEEKPKADADKPEEGGEKPTTGESGDKDVAEGQDKDVEGQDKDVEGQDKDVEGQDKDVEGQNVEGDKDKEADDKDQNVEGDVQEGDKEQTEVDSETPADPAPAEGTSEDKPEDETSETEEPEEEPEEEAEEEAPVFALSELTASAPFAFPGDELTFSFTATAADSVAYAIVSDAGETVAEGAAESAFTWTAGDPGAYTATVTAAAGEETLTASATVTVKPDRSGVKVTYTARYNGMDGFTLMPEYKNVELPRGDYDLANEGPVAPEGYVYVETCMDQIKLDRLTYVEEDRAWTYYAGETVAQLEADAQLVVAFDPDPTNHFYTYKDSSIIAEVRLASGSAVPDEAHFVVTPITNGRNYDAYMKALNDRTAEEYTETNTLLYDFAFVMDELNPETGEPTGRTYEIQPAPNTMTVKVTFRKNQITNVGAEDAADVGVVHMPLKDGVLERKNADTTAEATNISASDVQVVQQLADSKTDIDLTGRTDTVTFETNSFCVFAFTVDFTYNDATYSFPGEGTYAIKDIMAALGIEGELSEDPTLEYVEGDGQDIDRKLLLAKEDGEWVLKNEIPFTDTFKLTLTVGVEKYVIVVTDAAADGSLTVNITLYDYNDSTQLTSIPEDMGGSDNVYLFVWSGDQEIKTVVSSENAASTPWTCIQLTNFKGHDVPYTVNIDKLTVNSSNLYYASDNTLYSSLTNEQKDALRVRLVHAKDSAPTLGSIINSSASADFETMWNGGFEGFSMSAAHTTSTAPTSDGNYNINMKKSNTKEFDVVLDVTDLAADATFAEGSYVRLDATSLNGENHYYNFVKVEKKAIVEKDGKKYIYLPAASTWSDGQKYSENWSSITASVVKAKNGQTITEGGNANANAFDASYLMAGFLYEDMTNTKANLGSEPDADENAHIDHITYTFKLKPVNLEGAKAPGDVLGAAVDYGIVAQKYTQTGHTETNYAVKVINQSENCDIDGSGEGAAPFWVGSVESNEVRLSEHSTGKADLDIYCTEADYNAGKFKTVEVTEKEVQFIFKTQDEINSYVQGLIDAGQRISSSLAGKTTIKPAAGTESKKLIDVREFEDGKTIYVDCSNIAGTMASSGWHILKKPGQSIVFNIPGSSVSLGEFYVELYNNDGTQYTSYDGYSFAVGDGGVHCLGSTTAAKNADNGRNVAVDNIILQHITFNAYQASSLTLNNVSAAFLVPYGSVPSQSNGAGWILAGGDVISGAEWHFYRHTRPYTKVNLEDLNFKKVVTGGTDSTNPSFPFKLYLWTETVDAQGAASITYDYANITNACIWIDNTNVTNNYSFADGVLDTKPAKILSVDIQSGQTLKISGLVAGTKYKLVEDVNGPSFQSGYTDLTDGLTGEVAAVDTLREYKNHYNNSVDIEVEKVWKNADGTSMSWPSDVESVEIQLTKKVGDEEAQDVDDKTLTLTKDKPSDKFTGLPAKDGTTAITYGVKEVTVSGSFTSQVGSMTSDNKITVTNTKIATPISKQLEVTKALEYDDTAYDEAWPSEGFTFTLSQDDVQTGVTMPSTATATATKTSKTAKFDAIQFSEPGTYTFKIEENVPEDATNNVKNGIVYNDSATAVTVVVGYGTDRNSLAVKSVKYGDKDSLTVTNTYTASSTKKALVVTKEFKTEEGATITDSDKWPTDGFTFELAADSTNPDGATLPSSKTVTVQSNTTDLKATFGDITFSKPGTFKFTITELKPSNADSHITYDESAKTVIVTVTDNKTGALSAAVNYGSASATSVTVTNTYVEEQTGSVKVSKAFVGHAAPEGFKIEAKYKDGTSDKTLELKTSDTANRTGTGTETDPYIWTINDLPLNTMVTFTEYNYTVPGYDVAVTVGGTAVAATDTPSGTSNAVASPTALAFVNTYTQKKASVTNNDEVYVRKTDGTNKLDGATFKLYSDSGLTTELATYTTSEFNIGTEDTALASLLPTMNNGETTLYLKETKAPDGYTASDKTYPVKIKATVSAEAYDEKQVAYVTTTSYTMTIDGKTSTETEPYEIENTKNTGTDTVHASVKINKVDEDGKSLSGATFTLYKADKSTVVETYTDQSFEIKTADLTGNLPDTNGGTTKLYLKETKAPNGFELDSTEYEIVITATIAEALNQTENKFITTTTYKMTISGKENTPLDITNKRTAAPTTAAPTTAAPTTAAPTTAAPTTAAPTTAAPTTAAPTTAAPTTAAPTTVAPTTTTPTGGGATPTPAPTSVTGVKIWQDDNNAYKTRPDSITVQLYANGTPVDATPTWRNTRTNTWTYAFTNLPAVTDAGITITYTVKEVPVENYETSVEGTTITNKLIPKETEKYTELAGVKTWDDNDNVTGQRPTSITVHLLRDGVEVASCTATAADGWKYSFGTQPVDTGYGRNYEYEVREDAVPGYFCRENGMNLANKLIFADKPNGENSENFTSQDSLQVKSRHTASYRPKFGRMNEEEFEDLLDILDYGTPLWGMLGTGDETPVYPFVFAGVGAMAMIALVITRRKRRGEA